LVIVLFGKSGLGTRLRSFFSRLAAEAPWRARPWLMLAPLLLVLCAHEAHAQRAFYLDRVQVTGAPDDGLITRRPYLHDVSRVYGSATLGYVLNPLRDSTVAASQGVEDRIENLMRHQVLTYFNAGIEIAGRASIELALPVAWIQSGGDVPIPGSPPPSPSIFPVDTGTSLYDPSISGRVLVKGGKDDPFRIALGGMLFLPAGNFSRGGSDGTTTLYLYGAVEHPIGPVLLTGNIGPHFRPLRGVGGDDSRLDLGTELRVNAAAFLDLFKRLRLGAELNGMVGLADDENGDSTFFEGQATPFELLGSARYLMGRTSQTYARASAGTRFTNGYGAPDLRVMVSIGHWLLFDDFMPKDQTRVRGEPQPGLEKPSADSDRDGDGFPDDIDLCPDEKEDGQGPRPTDGCPVSSDRDGDGIPDLQDACPDAPEDKDGLQDADGCPEKDVDQDGIPDERDACPTEPGIEQGDAKRNGCPKQAPKQNIVEEDGQLRLLNPIQFESGTAEIKQVSFPVLNDVLQVMVERPSIRIAVYGHTDNRGSAAYNLKLSQERAQSVVNYLSEKGVALERLQYKGFGMEKPLVPNSSDDNRARNRRVEFKILEAAPEPMGAP
jgi:outer membrane protein OmpA-like peptidoglycan-associated protein